MITKGDETKVPTRNGRSASKVLFTQTMISSSLLGKFESDGHMYTGIEQTPFSLIHVLEMYRGRVGGAYAELFYAMVSLPCFPTFTGHTCL